MESEKERPEITCLMVSSVDGKGTGEFLFHKTTEYCLHDYFEQETRLGVQGYILGTNTLLTDYAPRNYKPDLSKFSNTNISKSEDYIAKEKGEYYVIAFDIEGEIPWKEIKENSLKNLEGNKYHIYLKLLLKKQVKNI